MKRLTLLLTLLLLLAGCGAPPASDAPETAEAPAGPETAESLRADYEAQGFTVREIVPYEGDLLVYYGAGPASGVFQWVYTKTGLRAPLLFSTQEVLDYEILSTGAIRVLAGGENVHNGARAFPAYETAFASLPVSPEGQVFADAYSNGNVSREPYWAPVERGYTFGWSHGPAALVDLRVSASGLEAVFGPTANNIGGFFDAASSIPLTETAFDAEARTLTLTFRDTALTSGPPPVYEDPQEQATHQQYAALYGLPTAFPAGPLADSNAFFSGAEVREQDGSVQVVLALTERAERYNVEAGQLLRDESRPYLSLRFRDSD